MSRVFGEVRISFRLIFPCDGDATHPHNGSNLSRVIVKGIRCLTTIITGRYQGSSSIIDLTAYVYSADLTSTDDLSITESLTQSEHAAHCLAKVACVLVTCSILVEAGLRVPLTTC